MLSLAQGRGRNTKLALLEHCYLEAVMKLQPKTQSWTINLLQEPYYLYNEHRGDKVTGTNPFYKVNYLLVWFIKAEVMKL